MKKILLIDDDQVFANAYRTKLSSDGFSVEVAHDGETGLEILRTFRPDAILLDLILPKMHGIEVIKKIRSEPETRQLPLFVFTNSYLTSTAQDAWKAGATKCLAKANWTPKQVVGVLRHALGGNGGNPATGPAAASTPASSAPIHEETDREFQTDLHRSFTSGLPATLAALRGALQNLIKAETETARVQQTQLLYRRVRGLTSNASLVGMFHITQMTDALEALLRDLYENPKNINISTLRTIAAAIDFLGVLFEQKKPMANNQLDQVNVLVVDDEAISRRAIGYALEKARLKSESLEDPVQALQVLCDREFDLIFLDVDMPNMNGYELCSKLRSLPVYKKTPVVFVTSLNDLENRASSSMSGGNDFIGKPFLFIELAVKALVYVLRARWESPKA